MIERGNIMDGIQVITPITQRNFKVTRRIFTNRENIAYGLQHLVGLIITAACTALLIVLNALDRVDPWKIVSYSLFCGGLIVYYGLSALSHILYISEKAHRIICRIDFCMVPFMIASCFMPICLVVVRGACGWTLFGLVWAYAVLAIIQRAIQPINNILKSIVLALLTVNILFAIILLTHIIEVTSLFFLTIGALFYAASAMIFPYKLIHYEKGLIKCHSLSHILMILGTICHFYLLFITTYWVK